MRSVLFVVLALTCAAGAAAQTYRYRAPRFERLVMERLRIGSTAQERALVFPCKPMGDSCASNPLAGGRMVFEGPGEAWQGYQLCRRVAPVVSTDSGEECVPFEHVFEAPAR